MFYCSTLVCWSAVVILLSLWQFSGNVCVVCTSYVCEVRIFNNSPAKSRGISPDTKIRWYSARLSEIIVLLFNKAQFYFIKSWRWSLVSHLSLWRTKLRTSQGYGRRIFGAPWPYLGSVTVCWITMLLIVCLTLWSLSVILLESNGYLSCWEGCSFYLHSNKRPQRSRGFNNFLTGFHHYTSSDFDNHTDDYRPNWTPLSPITIIYHNQCKGV